MPIIISAQNVGIGTTTPAKKLQIVGTTLTDTLSIGSLAPRAPLSFTAQLGEKVSFWDDGLPTGSNYGIGVQSGVLQIHTYNAADNIGLGYGSSNNFTERMRITGGGNIGINTISPQAYGHGGTNTIMELRNTVAAAGANQQSHIILSSATSSGSLGGLSWVGTALSGEKRTGFIGNIYESSNATKLAFFTRNNAGTLNEKMNLSGEGGLRVEGPSAVEMGNAFSVGGFGDIKVDAPGSAGGRLTIKENGNVGLNQSNPGARLDVNGDLNVNGPVRINGNAGIAGKTLTSNGAGNAAAWVSPTNQLFNNMYTFGSTASLFATGNGQRFDLPGLTQLISIQQTSKVLISMHMLGQDNGCTFCSNGMLNFILSINDGTPAPIAKRLESSSNGFNEDSGFRMLTLPAGFYTFKMSVIHESGADVILPAGNTAYLGNSMSIIVIPQ